MVTADFMANKITRNNTYKRLRISLIVIALIIIAIAALTARLQMPHGSSSAVPNLNLTDISASIKGATYYAVEVDQVTKINNSAISAYLESSVSVFNSTISYQNTVSSYPSVIESSVLLMNNASSALTVINSTILGSNIKNQTQSGEFLNGIQQYTYTEDNHTLTMLVVPTVFLFNNTQFNNTGGVLPWPLYRFTTLVAYQNEVGSVDIGGYSNNLNESIAILLTKALFNKMVNSQ